MKPKNTSIDSPVEQQKEELLSLLKIRGRLQTLFKDGNNLLKEDQIGLKERKKRIEEFARLITDYNYGFLAGKKQYALPAIKLPERMYDAAVLLGYKGNDNIIGPWKYISYVLSQNGVKGLYEETINDNIDDIVSNTLGLVTLLLGNGNDYKHGHIDLYLQEMLELMRGDLRGISFIQDGRTTEGRRKFLLQKIRSRLDAGVTHINEDALLKVLSRILKELQTD